MDLMEILKALFGD